LRLGETDVYVFGEGAFVEGSAMWVRGANRVDLAVHRRGDVPRVLTIRLRNGPVLNPVVVTVSGEERSLDLAPSSSAEVSVPLESDRPVRVSITSSAGFRPSDDGQTQDRRYLGVWVEFGEAPSDASPPPDQ
jgi:hypothetical protein